MKIQLKSQAGMVPIFEIIILVLVVAVGVGVYLSQKSVVNTQPEAQITKAKKATPTPVANYLVIKEFGVKIKLTEELKDLTYAYSNNSGYPNIGFSTKKLIDAEAAVIKGGQPKGCTAENGPFGILGRYKAGDLASYGEKIENITTAKHIREFYYLYSHPQSMCSDQESVKKLQRPDLLKAILPGALEAQ